MSPLALPSAAGTSRSQPARESPLPACPRGCQRHTTTVQGRGRGWTRCRAHAVPGHADTRWGPPLKTDGPASGLGEEGGPGCSQEEETVPAHATGSPCRAEGPSLNAAPESAVWMPVGPRNRQEAARRLASVTAKSLERLGAGPSARGTKQPASERSRLVSAMAAGASLHRCRGPERLYYILTST